MSDAPGATSAANKIKGVSILGAGYTDWETNGTGPFIVSRRYVHFFIRSPEKKQPLGKPIRIGTTLQESVLIYLLPNRLSINLRVRNDQRNECGECSGDPAALAGCRQQHNPEGTGVCFDACLADRCSD